MTDTTGAPRPACASQFHDDRVYAEDLVAGASYPLGSHTVTTQELLDFATAWDPQIFHLDEQVAEQGHFGGLITSGVHTLAIYQRLAVDHVFKTWEVVAGRRFRQVEFLAPVRPGDTLTGTLRIEQVGPGRQGKAPVVTSATLTNDRGQTVLSLELDAYLRTRPA